MSESVSIAFRAVLARAVPNSVFYYSVEYE